MPPGEIPVNCVNCGRRFSLPIAAVHRDNFYCTQCGNKIPLAGVRTHSGEMDSALRPRKPKRSSKPARRF